MQLLLLKTIFLIPTNIHAAGRSGGKHYRKPAFINLLCLIKKNHWSWLALKANVMASHNAGCRNRLIFLWNMLLYSLT